MLLSRKRPGALGTGETDDWLDVDQVAFAANRKDTTEKWFILNVD